jgi:hypothetical protein
VVVETGPLNPCTLQFEERKASRKLDADYPGLGRVNAIFVDGGFVGFTMMVARPTENRSLNCQSDHFVTDPEKILASLGDDLVNIKSGPDTMMTRVHDGVVYSIHRTRVTQGYPVDRTVFAVFVEAEANKYKDRIEELDPGWFPKREEDIQMADTRASRVFRQVGSGKSRSARSACKKGDLLGLLGKPVRKTIRTCEFPNEFVGSLKFKGASFWKYWPVMHTQIREANARMKLHGVGPGGRVMEVFIQIPDPGRRTLKDVDSTMGEGTEYGCGGRAWVIDGYVMRARPVGGKLNLAFTLLEDYDAFSILVPQASVYANWR